jgi:hypothetical protein
MPHVILHFLVLRILYGYFLWNWIFFLTEGARAEEKGRLVGRASVRALLPDPRATPCTPRMKPNAAAREKMEPLQA